MFNEIQNYYRFLCRFWQNNEIKYPRKCNFLTIYENCYPRKINEFTVTYKTLHTQKEQIQVLLKLLQ